MKKPGQAIIDALGRQGIVVDIATIGPRFEEKDSGIRLRFDRVALRFIEDVQSALHDIVPDDRTLFFAITAPIRMGSKTAAMLVENVRGVLARRRARVDLDETINGNRTRVRLVKGVFNGRRAVGFVHNPETDPELIFETTLSVLELRRPRAKSRRPARS
ncbi:MAG TPA: hypothetical protein VKR31_15435 [Rhizomicrobium sp.]|nr:hypothetical protein [Rhizomicrobium sp.]